MREIDILLAEDNEDHAFLTKKAISQIENNGFKYILHTVRDGEEVIKYIKKVGVYSDEPRPDLVLLDLNMPKKDGFEVLEELKGSPMYKVIPVIVLTSSAAEEDVMRSYGLGTNVYVTKPVNFEEFVEKVMSIPRCWCKVATLPPKNHRWGGGGFQKDTPG